MPGHDRSGDGMPGGIDDSAANRSLLLSFGTLEQAPWQGPANDHQKPASPHRRSPR